jgi:hypothetical protein
VKEVCRRIRLARSRWKDHNNAACRGAVFGSRHNPSMKDAGPCAVGGEPSSQIRAEAVDAAGPVCRAPVGSVSRHPPSSQQSAPNARIGRQVGRASLIRRGSTPMQAPARKLPTTRYATIADLGKSFGVRWAWFVRTS